MYLGFSVWGFGTRGLGFTVLGFRDTASYLFACNFFVEET